MFACCTALKLAGEFVRTVSLNGVVAVGSVVNYLLGYRENPESIDERSIDESFSKVDVPLDRDRRTLGFPHDPFSISQNSLEGLKQGKN